MIVQFEDLAGIRERHKNQKIVLTSGTFDLLHVGHLRFLNDVKALGDVMIIMLSGDRRVKFRKGAERPIIPENDRAQLLDALQIIDYVFIDPATKRPDEIDPVHGEILARLKPDFYANDGQDIRFWDIMDRSKFVIVQRSTGGNYASTSAIIDYIANQKH